MNRPLEGVTVVDLGQIYNGPYCTLLLALLGARVIKVEPPGGEHLRKRAANFGAGLPFIMLSSSKECVTLNLKTVRGRELLLEMVRRSDVLVENFAPGVMEKLGLGYAVLKEVNPRLIYAQSTGFGSRGPYAHYPAMDLTIQAIAGVMSVTGFPDGPPLKAGPAIADFFGGIHLFGGVMAALFRRERTGLGDRVEVAMLDAVYPSLMSSLGAYFGGLPSRTGNRHNGLTVAPYNVYPAMDGHIAIFCVSDDHWCNLLKLIGRTDLLGDERYADMSKRAQRMDEVDHLVESWTRLHRRDEMFQLLTEAGVPCAPVRQLGEVVNDPHLQERGMVVEIDHPQRGRVKVIGSPIRLDSQPELALVPAAELGQHNRQVYCGWLGLSQEELADLQARGVI